MKNNTKMFFWCAVTSILDYFQLWSVIEIPVIKNRKI